MSRLFRKILVCCAFSAASLSAQNIGVGVRGGLPLTDFVKAESRTGALTNVVRGRGNVIIGPMLDIRLPLGLGIEFDALYRRWDAEGVLSRGSANTWEFPLYGKLRAPMPVLKPYAGAGVNFQRLGDIGRFLGGASNDPNRRGLLLAGGLEIKVPFVRLSPEVRYTRWNNAGPIRSSNQVDFLIGISF
jgi:hypothetical protein